ncbi:MAG: GEVED domain-containing protein [Myxococcota bacterium]|jgi:hypothetical protein|nr:GEVED domain-containing protein [Myxococcota bacterium]
MRKVLAFPLLLQVAAMLGCGGSGTPNSIVEDSDSSSSTSSFSDDSDNTTVTDTDTDTTTEENTATESQSATDTQTGSESDTPSSTDSATDTDTVSETVTGTDTSSASETETVSDTSTGTATSTGSDTDSDTSLQLLDFGDAPDVAGSDSFYPTLLAHNGARHAVHAHGCFLGKEVDDELDAPTSNPGLGDDLTDLDDEDGVSLTAVVAGETNLVNVWLTCAGLSAKPVLQGWIDFNGDYDWDDAGEQIFVNEPLSDGMNTLKFDAPVSERELSTFARFRLSSSQNLGTTGLAPDGEVEDTAVRILLSGQADYGDLPQDARDPGYQTTRDNGGPYHLIAKGVQLGEAVDAEPDGQPSAKADGDDNADKDDEDGIAGSDKELIFKTGKNILSVSAVCEGLVATCWLQAWIDLNRDGDFEDTNETIIADSKLSTGEHEVGFSLPTLGPGLSYETFLRVRFSTLAGLPPSGFAPDGEVEDYPVTITSLIGPAPR